MQRLLLSTVVVLSFWGSNRRNRSTVRSVGAYLYACRNNSLSVEATPTRARRVQHIVYKQFFKVLHWFTANIVIIACGETGVVSRRYLVVMNRLGSLGVELRRAQMREDEADDAKP
jgi:hypothetical protein